MDEFDRQILRSICSTGYSDWTDNAEALAACQRLETEGFCRVVWDGPKCWRVYRSSEQLARGMAAIGGGQPPVMLDVIAGDHER